jgi:hypothetical protein
MFGSPDDSADVADATAGERGRRRLWVDGQPWIVREVPAPVFDRRGGTHLLFESLEVIRRVRTFPRDWMELDDGALYTLCLDLRQRKTEDQPDTDTGLSSQP